MNISGLSGSKISGKSRELLDLQNDFSSIFDSGIFDSSIFNLSIVDTSIFESSTRVFILILESTLMHIFQKNIT